MEPAFEKLIPPPGASFRCFDRAALQQPFKWHYHPEIELTLVNQGSGRRFVGDHVDSYDGGDLVLLGSNLPHSWVSDDFRGHAYDRHPAIVIQFHPEFLGETFFSLPEMAAVQDLLRQASRGLEVVGAARRTVAARVNQMVEQDAPRRLVTLLDVLLALAGGEDLVPLASEGYIPITGKKAQDRLGRIFQEINASFTDSTLTQESLAKLVEMHPAAFSRFFKRATGRTVVEYVNQLRVGLACRLLQETDSSVLDVCHRSGFNNVSNFNRRFRAIKRQSPREFRQQYPVGTK